MDITWNKINEKLPKDNQKILVWYENSIQTVRFSKGVWNEECKKYNRYGSSDQDGNNALPYAFSICGSPKNLFGQNVLYWAEIPELEIKEDVQNICDYVLENNNWNKDEFTYEKVYAKDIEYDKLEKETIELINNMTDEEREEMKKAMDSRWNNFLNEFINRDNLIKEIWDKEK